MLSCNTENKEKSTGEKSTTGAKEKSVSSGNDNTIEFYLNGDENHIVKKADVSLDEIKGKKMLNIATASMGDTKNLLVIDVKDIAPGRYSFAEVSKYGEPTASYMPDVVDVSNSFVFNNGSITIESNDGTLVSGTFEGSAKNKNGNLYSISKGKFTNCKIHKRLTSN
jgi:hypothetical protein